MSWISTIPEIVLAVCVVYVPGFLALLFARKPMLTKLALSPALSIVFSVGSGFACGLLNVPWTWIHPVAVGLAGVLCLAVFRIVTDRGRAKRGIPAYKGTSDLGWVFGFFVLAVTILLFRVTNIFGSPRNFSQTYDNIFHLSVIRYSSLSEIGSPLLVSQASNKNGGFYPNGFHNLAANVLSFFPNEIAASVAAVVVVFAAIVWPASCFYMISEIFGLNRVTAAGACLASASLSMMPILLLDYGVLYPLLAAYCLVPVSWMLTLKFFGISQQCNSVRWKYLPFALVADCGLAFSHPGAVVAILVLTSVALVTRSVCLVAKWGQQDKKQAVIWGLLSTAFCLLTVFSFVILRPSRKSSAWDPLGTVDEAVGSLIVNSGIVYKPLLVVSIFALIGLYHCVRTKKMWLLASWFIWAVMWIVAAAMPVGDLRWYLIGVWYTDPYRLAAFTAITAVPVIALGVQQLDNFWRSHLGQSEKAASIVSLLSIIACLATAQIEPGLRGADQIAKHNYVLDEKSELLTKDELALLDEAKEILPADAVVAVEPLNGSSLLYALEGIHTTATHIAFEPTPEQWEIMSHLDEASEMPQTCLAINELNVGYAIDFGEQGVHGRGREYPGFDSLENNPGFEEISRVGDKVLYKITACGK